MASLPSSSASKKSGINTKASFFPPLKRHTLPMNHILTHSLAEVFQIRIDKFDPIERRGELYGTVEVVDLEDPLVLYHRDRGNAEHIVANCFLSLTGPPRSISQIIGFAVNIDLKLRVEGDSEEEDIILSKWQLSWDAINPKVAHTTRSRFLKDFTHHPNLVLSQVEDKHQSAGYDQPLSATFEGPNGCSITMYYAIFQHAVQAFVHIEVIDVNAVPIAVEYNLRGTISGSYAHFENDNDSDIKDYCKTTLMKTKDFETVRVERWALIPPSRNIIAVPAYTSFILEADLWDNCSNLTIAKGKVEFTPDHYCYGVDYIKGDADIAIRVMVNWRYGSIIPKETRSVAYYT